TSVVPNSTTQTSGSRNLAKPGKLCIMAHAQFSSVGVVGCLINVNRVAYLPATYALPSCLNYCIKVRANGCSVNLLWIDNSVADGTKPANYDISYDAWNHLISGANAKDAPVYGGGLQATWEWIDNAACAEHLHTRDGKIPI
ncbi:hypothetical protein BU23DRAFT_366134, partial [Bimuria novae-zelandiae CBS 107.79]